MQADSRRQDFRVAPGNNMTQEQYIDYIVGFWFNISTLSYFPAPSRGTLGVTRKPPRFHHSQFHGENIAAFCSIFRQDGGEHNISVEDY